MFYKYTILKVRWNITILQELSRIKTESTWKFCWRGNGIGKKNWWEDITFKI